MASGYIRFGIRTKLTMVILLVSLFPLGFLGWQTFNEQKRVIQEEVARSHRELSNTLARGIYENLETTRKLVASIVELDTIKNLNATIADDFFKALLKHYHIFKVMYLVNGDGQIIAGDPAFSQRDRWSFGDALRRLYKSGSFSEVHPSPEGKGMLWMTLETVIKSHENGITKLLGIFVAEVDLAYIKDLLRDALKSSKSQGIILDDSGMVIAKSSPEVQHIENPSAEALVNDINVVRDTQGIGYLVTAVSLKKIAIYQYQAPDWTIILQIPEKQAFEAAYTLKSRIIGLLAATGIVSILLSFLIANSLISPLLHLIDGARHIGNGIFDHSIVPRSNDEIGELTKTFDETRINLKNTKEDLDYRLTQLQTLYEVGKAISSILDFSTLQNMILETVVKVLRAEKGSLMLLDETEKILTIGVAVGLSDEVTKETKVGVGEPIAGWVLETGKPLFVKDVESDHAFLAIKKENVKKGTLMSVPLKAKDKLVGVINVSRSVPNSFKTRDFELFQNLANQAAIAIENARLYRFAVTDEMTKLYNHRYFQQRLDEELQRADRYDSTVSLIILDVDHFKKFNDTYGHPEGDRVLKTVARLIEKSVREIDIPARYGGEEFVVICPEKDGEGTLIPANRIRTTIETYDFRINGVYVPITVSLGVANYPAQSKSKSELIVCADTALYYSKESGRNRSSLYSPEMKAEEMIKHKEAKKKKE